MSQLWDLVGSARDRNGEPMSARTVARVAGIGSTTLVRWQKLHQLPGEASMRAVARAIGVPYRELLEAALRDTGYLREGD